MPPRSISASLASRAPGPDRRPHRPCSMFGLVPVGGSGGIGERAQHGGHVPHRRPLEPALGQGVIWLSLEIDNREVVAGDQHLAQVKVAVEADGGRQDPTAAQDAWQPGVAQRTPERSRTWSDRYWQGPPVPRMQRPGQSEFGRALGRGPYDVRMSSPVTNQPPGDEPLPGCTTGRRRSTTRFQPSLSETDAVSSGPRRHCAKSRCSPGANCNSAGCRPAGSSRRCRLTSSDA